MNQNNPEQMPFNQVFGTGSTPSYLPTNLYMGLQYNPYVGGNTATVAIAEGTYADQTWMDLSDVYNDGMWHEYEFIKDSTLGANSYLRLYLDGVLAADYWERPRLFAVAAFTSLISVRASGAAHHQMLPCQISASTTISRAGNNGASGPRRTRPASQKDGVICNTRK